ncbi:hypothetical protein ACOMHN_005820 [Nucella lapillus]
MAGSADLQQQCSDLLSQLKTNQVNLWQRLTSSTGPSSLDNNLETQFSNKKPEYARQKLKSIMKNKGRCATGTEGAARPISSSAESQMLTKSCKGPATSSSFQLLEEGQSKMSSKEEFRQDKNNSRPKLIQGEKDEYLSTDVLQDYFESRTTNSLMEGGTDSFNGAVSAEDNAMPQFADKPTTPLSVQRRRIIDRNVHVDSKLSDEDLQELERNTRGLNFSYSQSMDAAGDQSMVCKETAVGGEGSEAVEEGQGEEGRSGDTELTYQKHLVDRGNNRQLNTFIRDTTIKPKTILNSTHSVSHNYSKQGPGVSFQSTSSASGNSSLFRSQARERRLLGYDWIAALVGNDTGLIDESESYFQELRDFRRSNRDECCNDFYMEGPFTLSESEPPAVEKAIKDTKVQPFTVNDRLFTVPVTENLLGEPLEPGNKDRPQEEPTQEEPRFVRVSIPRATLQMPYKVRPHRRRSFDASDSCSLMDHCLKGWNAVSPATLPTASGVSLTDAMSGVNPKHTTTLKEAEKAACMHHWPLLTDPQPSRPQALPPWRRQLLDTTTLPLPAPPHAPPSSSSSLSLSLSSSLAGAGLQGARSGDVQRRTDELLNSTYSMMYEMQKMREAREEEQRRHCGKMVS